MAKRKSISKKNRFEVFKRDSFTCQYCGQAAPDVKLEIDHIKPVSKGGDNDILNLVTACYDCNRGKKARRLNDDAVIKKRKAQLDKLQERREQLEMMLQWEGELSEISEMEMEVFCKVFHDLTDRTITDIGRKKVARQIKKHGLDDVLDTLRFSCARFDGTDRSANYVLNNLGKSRSYKIKQEEKPYLKDLYYIRGIMRNRLAYVHDWKSIQIMEDAYEKGVEVEELKRFSLEADNWTEWQDMVSEGIEDMGE